MSRDGFTFQGTGTLSRVDRFTTKGGKDILTLIFRFDGQYPQVVPIKVFGRLAAESEEDLVPGTVLTIHGRLGGRDWNGKVFGEAVAERIDVTMRASPQGEFPGTGGDGPPPLSDDDVPF